IIIKNAFDASSYATYSFLFLEDNSLHNDSNVIRHYRSENGSFGMMFFDSDTFRVGGIESIQFTESVKNLPLMQRVRNETRVSNNANAIFVGSPQRFNFAQKEFIGINIAMPIMDKNGKYIGAVGFMFDLQNFASYLLSDSLNLYEGDTRSLVTQDGILAVSSNDSILLKNLQEVNNRPETNAVLDAIRTRSSAVFNNYITTSGVESFASVVSFSTLHDSSHWSIFVTSPKKSVLEPLYKLQLLLIFVGIIFLIIVLGVVYYCVQVIVARRLPILVNSLENFFRFLNHEKVQLKSLKINANDELGKMGSIINENIQKTQKGLEQDTKAVEQAVETA
ncbi:MAG: cache domain-containing protein, partial [Helicobacter sp.]|nr:cache domain-containing protein [Helicobacter sp.]